jgi:hypothetical protein
VCALGNNLRDEMYTVAFKMSIDLVKDLFILRDIVDFFQEGHNLRF